MSCHTPSGAACTATKAGQFGFKTKKERLCLLCHERGTATQHTKTRSDCLSCHLPHGSDQSGKLLRAAKKDETNRSGLTQGSDLASQLRMLVTMPLADLFNFLL